MRHQGQHQTLSGRVNWEIDSKHVILKIWFSKYQNFDNYLPTEHGPVEDCPQDAWWQVGYAMHVHRAQLTQAQGLDERDEAFTSAGGKSEF